MRVTERECFAVFFFYTSCVSASESVCERKRLSPQLMGFAVDSGPLWLAEGPFNM